MGARWALWKRAERLTERQQAKLATVEHVNRRLYRDSSATVHKTHGNVRSSL
jgi:hypothetical protein